MLQPLCTHGNEGGTSTVRTSQPGRVLANPSALQGWHFGKGAWSLSRPPPSTYSGWEVTAGFKLLQQTRQGKGGEEEDAAPEEDVGRVGAVASTGRSLELPMQRATFLEKQSIRTRRKTGITGGFEGLGARSVILQLPQKL